MYLKNFCSIRPHWYSNADMCDLQIHGHVCVHYMEYAKFVENRSACPRSTKFVKKNGRRTKFVDVRLCDLCDQQPEYFWCALGSGLSGHSIVPVDAPLPWRICPVVRPLVLGYMVIK